MFSVCSVDFLGVASQEIFGGNLFKEVAYARNNLKFREAANKIFKKISTENALEFLAFGKGFIMDRLRLEILTKILRIIFNKNEV